MVLLYPQVRDAGEGGQPGIHLGCNFTMFLARIGFSKMYSVQLHFFH